MEFCNKCGSLKISSSCTNKKCNQHVKSLVELATSKQLEYIRELAEQLSVDISDIDFEVISKVDAIDLIDDYLERLDDPDKKLVANGDAQADDDDDDDDDE